MTFEQWLAANGYDAEKLTDANRKHLEAAWRAETQATQATQATTAQVGSNAAAGGASTGGSSAASKPDTFTKKMEELEAETKRISYIRERTVQGMEKNRGDLDKQKRLRELGAAAEADEKMDARAFDLALMRLDSMVGPMILTPNPSAINEDVIEAAVCSTYRLAGVEKRFSEQTLEAAHRRFKNGLSLKHLLHVAAQRNSGYRGDIYDIEGLCRAAFPRHPDPYHGGYRAEGPISTISVPGILSNVANKFLAVGFLFTEQAWRMIAKIKTATDFKQMSTYRLTGNNKFTKVPPGGEIKHGTLSELKYTNQVDTYGKMLGIDRRDIVNDDLSAFTGAGDELGRGAGDSLNEVFWKEWLDDATFFPTDKSLANYDDGAVDSVLSLAGLENADALFRLQTKPDGTPLGIIPAIALVPTGLRITARNLVNSTQIVGQGASAGTVPANNPWAGAFKPVDSAYLTQSAIGGSSTAWYLLADPMNVAAIEVAFLFGKEAPTVETAEFDFNMLGISMRAYMDFGCAKQEYRAGVKMKGAA